MANIRDVARHAGVSITTVSVTLSESRPVSAETRKRVWAAVKAVGYSPNAFARGLRSGRSRLIGVAICDISNPFWAAMVRVVEKVAIAAGYSIVLCNTDDDPARELAVLEQLRVQQVAGILLTPLGRGAAYLRQLERPDMPPIVTLDHKVAGLSRDFVGVDNRAACRMLTQYLLRLGHRRIGLLGGTLGLWTSEEREAGFRETMKDAGVEIDPALCISADYNGDLARTSAIALLTQPNRPTAILAANNVMALGALQAILDLGFRCPADVSLAGIDDVPWSDLVRPRITTASQPIEEISRVAIEWLLERISGVEVPARDRIFQPKMFIGESCADLRPGAASRSRRPREVEKAT
jgi:LacI family transcriptional regulator